MRPVARYAKAKRLMEIYAAYGYFGDGGVISNGGGVPLLNGFLSKEMFFSETLHQHLLGSFSWLLPTMATIAAAFSVAYSLRFIHDVFFNGTPINLPKFPPHEPPRYMKIPVEVLVFCCLLVGVLLLGRSVHYWQLLLRRVSDTRFQSMIWQFGMVLTCRC